MSSTRACLPALAFLAFALGCSATSSNQFTGTGGEAAGGGSASSSAGTGGGINIGGSGPSGTGTGAGVPVEEEVYAHSADTLYKLDPVTKVVTVVGPFQGCGDEVIDIAIDKNGAMFATTTSSLAKVDKATAKCTTVKQDGGFPNSLSFVPQGTVDPNAEALVGYQGSTYVRISTTTGAITPLGDIGGGYVSSGDVVSVIGGGTYLTVTGPGCFDCIIEVNPKNGSLVKLIGPLGHSSVYGLAYWGGSAYGFDAGGELFSIDLATGQSTSIFLPNAPAGLSFYGAGSSTAAPLKPPS